MTRKYTVGEPVYIGWSYSFSPIEWQPAKVYKITATQVVVTVLSGTDMRFNARRKGIGNSFVLDDMPFEERKALIAEAQLCAKVATAINEIPWGRMGLNHARSHLLKELARLRSAVDAAERLFDPEAQP